VGDGRPVTHYSSDTPDRMTVTRLLGCGQMRLPWRGVRLSVVTLLVLLAGVAHAAPEVQVRAGTRIVVDRLAPTGDGITLRGRVVEPATGRGLPDVELVVIIDNQRRSVTTDDGGVWRVRYPGLRGRHIVSARLEQDAEYLASELPELPFDVARATPKLELVLPLEVERTGRVDGTVAATLDDEPVELTLDLVAESPSGATPLGRVTTDASGRALVSLPAQTLGAPGEHIVVARFAGDTAYNAISAEQMVRVMSTTSFASVALERTRVPADEDLVITGRLVDELGEGVGDAQVVASVGSERMGATTTEDDGRFRIGAGVEDLPPGDVSVGVAFTSTTLWRRGARATPLTATILEPRSVPVRYTLITVALTAVIVAAFLFARGGGLRRLLDRLRSGGEEATPAPAAAPTDAPARGGLTLGKAGRMSSLRRAQDDTLTGRVVDAVTSAAVPGASLDIEATGQPAVGLVADGAGLFSSPALPPGAFEVTVRAPGYVRERFAIAMPHRGEYRDVKVSLLPVREAIFALYRQVALPRLPRGELWGVWTPRELLEHVRRHRPGAALARLTDLVEESYFSPRQVEESILDEVGRLVEATRAELDAPRA
jgi:hypothetical protein